MNFDTSKSVTEALNAFSVNRFLEDLKKQKPALTILMIEGPHDLGGAAIQGSSGPGLVIPALKNNGEIVFAMAFEEGHIPNSEPAAGASLFTRTVADLLSKRGPTAARVFDEARTEVLRQPGNGQIPTVDPLLTGSENFCFVEPPPPAVKEIPSVPKNSRDHEEYVKIPHGTFKMGCVPADTKCKDDEKPQHPVTLTSDFWLGRNEVKVGSFKHYVEVGNKKLKLRRAPLDYDGWKITELPMVRVTWEEAQDYCKWAGGRLPTEAEWERAARAGNDNEIYPLNSEDSREKANFYGKKGNDTWDGVAPVGQFEASKYNLFDMSGNVWEWVYDWYDDKYYSKSPEADPKGPATGKKHVVRGGSFDSPLEHLRISLRWQPQGIEDLITGFRCVLEDSPETQRLLGRN